MSREKNIAMQVKMIEAINRGQLQIFHEIFAADVIDHDPASDQEQGVDGFIQFFTSFREAFPDLKVEVDSMVADEYCVAIAVSVTGTHMGPFRGIAATGRKIRTRGLQIARYDHEAKLKERWGSSDELGMLRQIGFTIDI